jgi:hypothetical protein
MYLCICRYIHVYVCIQKSINICMYIYIYIYNRTDLTALVSLSRRCEALLEDVDHHYRHVSYLYICTYLYICLYEIYIPSSYIYIYIYIYICNIFMNMYICLDDVKHCLKTLIITIDT